MVPEQYDAQAIEKKWQERWASEGTYQVDNDDPRPRHYVLSMYPYPSGPAHMGHVRNYTFGDLLVRHRTMQGFGVLSPFGFDSFGLPAENAAIKTGVHPRTFTDEKIVELTASIKGIGAVHDWRREVSSHDPEFMRFTQTIFLRFLEQGLAYRAKAPVNWCPGCHTVLANEQVLGDGTCERSGDVVEKRDLEQWFFKITDYAQELLDDLDGLDWPERVKTMQRNWIGRSEGAEFEMQVVGTDHRIKVFTTRPDTSFGMTYAVLAPEHPLALEITTQGAVRRRRAVHRPGPDDERHRSPLVRGGPRQARRLHRRARHEPVHRRARADLPRRLRPRHLRHRGDHGRARSGPARLGLRQGVRPPDRAHRAAAGRLGTARPTRAMVRPSTASGSTGSASPTPRPRPSSGWRPRASASAR